MRPTSPARPSRSTAASPTPEERSKVGALPGPHQGGFAPLAPPPEAAASGFHDWEWVRGRGRVGEAKGRRPARRTAPLRLAQTPPSPHPLPVKGSKGSPLVGVQGAKPPGGVRGEAPALRASPLVQHDALGHQVGDFRLGIAVPRQHLGPVFAEPGAARRACRRGCGDSLIGVPRPRYQSSSVTISRCAVCGAAADSIHRQHRAGRHAAADQLSAPARGRPAPANAAASCRRRARRG